MKYNKAKYIAKYIKILENDKLNDNEKERKLKQVAMHISNNNVDLVNKNVKTTKFTVEVEK